MIKLINSRTTQGAAAILSLLVAVAVWWFGDGIFKRQESRAEITNPPPRQALSPSAIITSNSGPVEALQGDVSNVQGDVVVGKKQVTGNITSQGAGDAVGGDKNTGVGAGAHFSNGGNVHLKGDDHSRNFTGSNNGVVVQGDSNTTVIH